VKKLRRAGRSDKELAATLTDMEAFAYLGRYYADKIRGAAELALYRADPSRKASHQEAVRHLEHAIQQWEAYTEVAANAYHPQLYSRVHYLDWEKLLNEVRKEAETVRTHPLPGQ
jgi:hypothetical protein